MSGDRRDFSTDRSSAARGERQRHIPGERATLPTESHPRRPLLIDVGDASDRTLDYAPGARLGAAYEIEEIIGRGGMGVVYRALDLRSGQVVAIKQLPARAPRAWRARLHDEGVLLARASHPNIAQAHDVFVTDDGAPHLVMEHVGGETLSDRLSRGPLEIGAALEICRSIADAVRAAHEENVLHRDLKPGNVMITESGEVKVLDFGLAVERRSADDAAGAGRGGGTPGYTSPEQRRGDPQSIGTDVFAFGCVLHDCLVGLAGDRSAPRDVLDARDVTVLPAEAPEPVRELIERCLRDDPRERPADMRAVCRTLGAVVDGLEVAEVRLRPPPPSFDDAREPLVGRDRDLVVLARRLRSERAVTLVGPAGIGKTRLALALVDETRYDFRGGTCLVELSGIREPHRVAELMFRALEPDRRAPGSDLEPELERCIGDRHLLLVIDDPGHVVDAGAGLVARLLGSCARLHVLATCREPLGFSGERTEPVAPLEAPATGTADPAAIRCAAAVRLFIARAGGGEDGSIIDDATLLTIAAICRHLEGNPFSIGLAAGQARSETPDAVLARLRAGESQRTVLDLALEMLPADAVELLGAVRVFAGGFTGDQAARLVRGRLTPGAVTTALETLQRRKLLLRRPGAAGRFELPELIRELAAERFASSRDEEAMRDRHHRIFRAFARRARAGLYDDQRTWLDRIDDEHENILAALWWSERGGGRGDAGARVRRVAGALRMVSTLGLYWDIRGLMMTGRGALDRALSLPGTTAFPRARARALNAAGNMAQRSGDAAAAKRLFLEALMLHRAQGDETGASRILNGLGVLAFDAGELEDARAHYRESVEIKTRKGLDDRLAIPLNNLGRIELLLGDAASARVTLARAVRTCAAGDRHTYASAVNNLGIAELRLGEEVAAREALGESLAIRRGIGDRAAISFSVDGAAELALHLGEPSRAAEWRGAAERLRSELHTEFSGGDRAFVARVDRGLCERLGEARWREHVRAGRRRVWEMVVDEVAAFLPAER